VIYVFDNDVPRHPLATIFIAISAAANVAVLPTRVELQLFTRSSGQSEHLRLAGVRLGRWASLLLRIWAKPFRSWHFPYHRAVTIEARGLRSPDA
jgi:hypothetical protein